MPSPFGKSDLMQFYLNLWLDSGGKVTLSYLGDWEKESVFEVESYLNAYVRKLRTQIETQRKISHQQKRRSYRLR